MKKWLIKSIDKSWKWFFSAFDTHSKGMSSRKSTAFVLVLLYGALAWRYTTPENLEYILMTTAGFCLALLGLTTFSDFRGSKDPPEPPIESS
jgi:hypothetical protein